MRTYFLSFYKLNSFVSLESILLNPTLMLPGVGNCNPLQHSCLENSTDREAWRAKVHIVHVVSKCRIQLGEWTHKYIQHTDSLIISLWTLYSTTSSQRTHMYLQVLSLSSSQWPSVLQNCSHLVNSITLFLCFISVGALERKGVNVVNSPCFSRLPNLFNSGIRSLGSDFLKVFFFAFNPLLLSSISLLLKYVL